MYVEKSLLGNSVLSTLTSQDNSSSEVGVVVRLVPWWLGLKLTRCLGQPKAGWLVHKHI